ncbi:hypothetical protein [Singulisphaera sp. PoT]|uniref:hypothetical protein n=1 Tax=Singulisphaera sp. PoT TaxID=3411797 RepID=UPI003BF53E31
MFSKLLKSDHRRVSSSSPSPARSRKRKPALESLEGRQLMSVGPEFYAPVNTTTRNAQYDSDNATSNNGTSVVVWTDTYSNTDHDIRAQRMDRYGNKVGPEIVVSYSSLDEGTPSVAIDAFGDFVVAWRQTQTSGDTNVVAQRFNANGAAVGGVIQVGAGTFKESDPEVGMDAWGDFVVAYTRNTNNNNPDIFAKRYDSYGNLTQVVNVATTAKAETNASVSMAADGQFAVAWEEAYSSSDHDIKMNRYNAYGGLAGSSYIASSTSWDELPSVAIDSSGNTVVAWDRNGTDIKARRVSNTGVMGAEINISSSSTIQGSASVALKPSGGGFVVAYQSFSNIFRNKVAEVSASNQVTTIDAGAGGHAVVSMNIYGDYILTYTSSDAGDANIRGRRGHLS